MADSNETRPVVAETQTDDAERVRPKAARKQEHGGPTGPEPTRYGDWEKKGRCIDF